MKEIHDLVEVGKVRYGGASSIWGVKFARIQVVAEKNGCKSFRSVARVSDTDHTNKDQVHLCGKTHYDLLHREEEYEMNRFCGDTGVVLIPWSYSTTSKQLR